MNAYRRYNSRVQPDTSWPSSASIPPLSPDAVQVWRIALDQPAAVEGRLRALLSPDERERADRFYFPHLKTHFTVARGAVRILLGAQTGQDPAAIRFAYAQHGKPFLPGSELQFNLSHSGTLGLVAIARDRALGIDIEQVRAMDDAEAVARRNFAPAEVAEYLTVPQAQRAEAFFNCWTRKEAFIKAIGDGLAYPLAAFRVSLLPDAAAKLLEVRGNPGEADRWGMAALHPGPGYAAALVAEGRSWGVQKLGFGFN